MGCVVVLVVVFLIVFSRAVDSWMLHATSCDDCGDDSDSRTAIGLDEDHPRGRDDPTDDEDRHIFGDDDLLG